MKEYIIKVGNNPDIMGNYPLLEKAKELVRCKDCKHYRYYGLESYTVSECKINNVENQNENWFCADGERK